MGPGRPTLNFIHISHKSHTALWQLHRNLCIARSATSTPIYSGTNFAQLTPQYAPRLVTVAEPTRPAQRGLWNPALKPDMIPKLPMLLM